MAEQYNSVCISQVAATVLGAMGVNAPADMAQPITQVQKLIEARTGKSTVERAVLYNPDAVAMWLLQQYTDIFTPAMLSADIMLPMLSVMPSVTPVCFGTMYSGVMPQVHGITSYTKPVLKVDTIFDCLAAAGKRVALISTTGDSMSLIFLERSIDYFIYDSVAEINKKAIELIERGEHDVIVVYNANYDSTMHKTGTHSVQALAELADNTAFFARLVQTVRHCYTDCNTLLGFMPDHGCHDIDGDCGSHGLDMVEDMNIIHFYSVISGEKR